MTLNQAKKIINGAIKKAEDLNIAVSVCVVDDHGTLVASEKMDNALTISPEFAYAKAYTAAVIKLPTAGIAQYAGENKPFYGVTSALGGKMMTIAGGLPINVDGKTIGGIGVGGSHDVNQDLQCAEAGLKEI